MISSNDNDLATDNYIIHLSAMTDIIFGSHTQSSVVKPTSTQATEHG